MAGAPLRLGDPVHSPSHSTRSERRTSRGAKRTRNTERNFNPVRPSTSPLLFTQIVKEIGKGSFGTVFLVKHKDERTGNVIPLVMKKVKLAGQNARERHACLREMTILSTLSHPALLGFRDAWLERGHLLCMLTEHCNVEACMFPAPLLFVLSCF